MRHLALTDHAFAGGPVFLDPGGYVTALRMTSSLAGARLLQRVWRCFRDQAVLGEHVRLGVTARLVNRNPRETVTIGDESVVRGILRNERNGRIAVGTFVYVGDDVIVSAFSEVTIGDGTLIGHGAQIFDNNTHPTDAAQRVLDFRKKLGYRTDQPLIIDTAPVRIGKRCWLGMNTIVMKGVTIGDDSIVASGSVVTRDLPAGIVAAGNPARAVKEL